MLIQFRDCVTNIKNLEYGAVVEIFEPFLHETPVRTFGHIQGFSQNKAKELILVLSVNKETREIHPGNIVFNIL